MAGRVPRTWAVCCRSTRAMMRTVRKSVSSQTIISDFSLPSIKRSVVRIIARRKVMVRYRRYGRSDDSEFVIEPYCIKLFKRRWYLLCHNAKRFMVLSFDRMTSLEQTEETFEMDKKFDTEAI